MDVTDGNVIAEKTSEEARIDVNQEQFEVELEFVQCLASPSYLNCKFAALNGNWKLSSLSREGC